MIYAPRFSCSSNIVTGYLRPNSDLNRTCRINRKYHGENMKRVTLFVVFLFAITAVASKSYGARHYGHQLAITTTSLPSGTVGNPYSGQITATGGTAPYTLSAHRPAQRIIHQRLYRRNLRHTGAKPVGTVTVAITVTDSTHRHAKSATANLRITIELPSRQAHCPSPPLHFQAARLAWRMRVR